MLLKKLILITFMLFNTNSWAYNEADLIKLKTLNAFKQCDLSSVDLSDANLTDTDLTDANLEGANLMDQNCERIYRPIEFPIK